MPAVKNESLPPASLPPVSGTSARADMLERANLVKTIIEAVPGGVVHVAADGSIVDANAEALRILGFRFEPMSKRFISDWDPETIHEDGRPCPLEDYPVARVLSTGKPQGPVTIGIRRPDGDMYWAVFRAVPTTAPNGQLTGAIVTFLDITERKRIEEQVRKSELKWRLLAENSPDFVMVANRNLEIESINRLREDIADDVIGKLATTYIDPEYVDDWRQNFERALETSEPVRFDTRSQTNGGREVWYDSVLVPLHEEGARAERVLVVARDITERRVMMSKLAEKERLASVGMVAASVAHEIMNPLAYILANLDFALGERCDSDERRNRAMKDAREGAARMQQIVWDLRSLGRSGAEELFYVDVRSVIETAMRLANPEVGRVTNVHVELDEVPGVLASESRLCQVFINLLVNAAQAMEGRPADERELRVRTHVNEDETLVGVAISDTGSGIAPEARRRIFEPFYTTKRSGTGLGLSISRECIERMGGRIEVESEVGRGTTFTVWLSTTRSPAVRS